MNRPPAEVLEAARRPAGKGISGRQLVTCQPGHLPTLAIDFNVNVDPVNHPNEHYEMTDSITLRNAPRCT